jgi:hypothetical protein
MVHGIGMDNPCQTRKTTMDASAPAHGASARRIGKCIGKGHGNVMANDGTAERMPQHSTISAIGTRQQRTNPCDNGHYISAVTPTMPDTDNYHTRNSTSAILHGGCLCVVSLILHYSQN